MSQDGSWIPPEPIRLPGMDLSTEEQIADLRRELELRNAWIRQNREALEQAERRAEQAEAIVAALVRKYGENYGTSDTPRYRVVLTDPELGEATGAQLQTMMDPCSGALLLRFRPE